MLDNMIQLIEDFDMIPPGSTVLCAVSGGADSVYLLHRLHLLRLGRPFTLYAAHYNHNLRGAESDRDEQFVRDFVRGWCGQERVGRTDGGEDLYPPVELIVGSGDVAGEARRRRLGLEETAREMRYAFLRETAERVGADRIATAHNADDNAETQLLHLLRGSGLRGLGGIAPRRGELIRPLLTTTRAEIEEYLRLYSIPHVEDSSNAEDGFLRNRLRHQVLPLLEKLAPGFTGRSRESIARLRADEDYLTAQAEDIAAQAAGDSGGLRIPAAAVAKAPDSLAARAVRCLIGRLNGGDQDCAAVHLETVVRICRGSDPSAQVSLPYGLTARREYEALVLTRRAAPAPLPETVLTLPGETAAGEWHILCENEVYQGQRQGTFEFWLAQAGPLLVRPRRTGDALRRPGRPLRTLKKLMIDEKIPRWQRDSLPVLECAGQVAAAAGLGSDAAFAAEPGGPAWHVRIRPGRMT